MIVLGVEGGGSHTHAMVADSSGEPLGVATTRDPSNWEDVGIEAAGGAIKSCVRSALDSADRPPGDVAASVFNLAGVDFPVDTLLLGGIPEALGLGGPVQIANDAFAALRAGTPDPFGVVVAAGTGSIVAGRNPAGEEFRTLGLGPLSGDSGSASEVSEAGVTAVALAHIGRGPSTALSQVLCEATDSPSVVEFVEGTGRGRIDPSRFAHLVVQAAGAGDAVAGDILRRAGEGLGATAIHVVRTLGMEDLAFDLILAGGMFRSGNQDLIEGLSGVVRAAAPEAALALLDVPAVVGSVLLALELAGRTPGSEARTSLAEGMRSQAGSAFG